MKPKEYSYRVVNDETLCHLYDKVTSRNFSDVVEEENIENSVFLFHENLLQMYNECCPIKTKSISVKYQLKPWINPQVKALIERRENMFKIFKRSLITRTEFTFVRNELTSINMKSKKSYYQNLFNTLRNYIKKIGKQ